MRRFALLFWIPLLASLAVAPPLRAQEVPPWRPATTTMPTMPTVAELRGDWMSGLGAWFRGLDEVAGVAATGLRASGSPRAGSSRAEVARFQRGPVPVVVMLDRNGDDRADMIEYYRDGRLVAQVIDADYNGEANSLRFYDTGGALLREVRL